jgi:hypothetical protein
MSIWSAYQRGNPHLGFVHKDYEMKHGRAAATNHKDLLPNVKDGRERQARRFRDVVRQLIADAGGIENCSEVKLGLVRRLAAATVLSEDLEGQAINGEPVSISEFCQLASTSVRLATRIGIERVARDVGSSLGDLLRRDFEHQQREKNHAD